MPWPGFIARIVHDHQALDNGAAEIRDGSVTDWPAEDAKPANKVGERLLSSRRAKFGDPV